MGDITRNTISSRSALDNLSIGIVKGNDSFKKSGVTSAQSLKIYSSCRHFKLTTVSVEQSENFKAVGNLYFKQKNFLDAYDSYTNAIESCPGITGKDILNLINKVAESNEEEKRKKPVVEISNKFNLKKQKNIYCGNIDKNFTLPSHKFAHNLSIFHNNRAACLIHLDKFDEALTDCNIAVLLNPRNKKAIIRRMTVNEKTGCIAEALIDAKNAHALDPYDMYVQRNMTRLETLENIRLAKMKEETIVQLKNLGNNLLSNFGLSLDNFKAEQDPKTGSYNISFNQNR